MYFTDFLIKGASPSHNKAYALHSLAVVRATPNRGEKTAATSHKQNVVRKILPPPSFGEERRPSVAGVNKIYYI